MLSELLFQHAKGLQVLVGDAHHSPEKIGGMDTCQVLSENLSKSYKALLTRVSMKSFQEAYGNAYYGKAMHGFPNFFAPK